MKNLILIIGMFVATSLNEQRTYGKCYAKLRATYRDTDTTYMLWFRDTRYSHIVSSFSYSGSKSEVQTFLKTCEKAYNENKEFTGDGYKISCMAEGGSIFITHFENGVGETGRINIDFVKESISNLEKE
jgi:hypothetical protein